MRLAMCFLVLCLAVPLEASARDCTREEAEAAEEGADRLSDWKQIYSAFVRFSHCDDGAIAEGHTESVVHLLSTHWETFPQLVALTNINPDFLAFVLRHINETADADELRHIAHLANANCPSGQYSLCTAISKVAIGDKHAL